VRKSRTKTSLLMNVQAALVIGIAFLSSTPPSVAQTVGLVDNPFITTLPNWVDAFPSRGGNWRLSLHNPTLMDTNNANPPVTGGGINTGLYEPDVLVADAFAAPDTYDVSARMRTNDDDLLGLVWNYLDPNNYFRVGIRQQPASGTFGGTEGLSVQKIVGGVVTQLTPVSGTAGVPAITQEMIDNRTPFDLKVAVSGTSYEVFFNGASMVTGTDPDLVTGRKIGVQSWAQQTDVAAVTPFWGTEVESISVNQGAVTLFSQSFAARPTPWRQLTMTNAAGISGNTPGTTREVLGNFGLDLNDGWILQHSNGFLNATFANTDFIGPAVVVDGPGSAAFSDYEMRLRLGTTDNDGIGVLVRVQDDNNFYRITFTNENTGAAGTRAPRGMSVQKVRNGVWTELYRDDALPLFVYTPGTVGLNPATGLPMFDLTVRVVGDSLAIEVIDAFANVIAYPLITDAADPLLTGTVGLHTWGTDNVFYTSFGNLNLPLLVAIPEPSTAALAICGFIGMAARRRRLASA
jgi:hypothetical protein